MLSFLLLVGCFFGNVNDQLGELDEELSELSETVEDQAVLIEELEAENAALLSELESLQEGGGSAAAPSLEYTLDVVPNRDSAGSSYHNYDYSIAFAIIGDVEAVRVLEYANMANTGQLTTLDHADAQCEAFTWSGLDELPYHAFVVEAWRGAERWCWEWEPYSDMIKTDCAAPGVLVTELTCD